MLYSKKENGFMLVELILVLALLGMVIATSFLLLGFGQRVHRASIDEYVLQSNTRLTAAYINNITRHASATFTIPESSFKEDNLTDSWNYIGVLDGAVVLYEYGEKNGVIGHHKTELVPASDHLTYEIFFEKQIEDYQEKIVGFTIKAFQDGKEVSLDHLGIPIGHMSIFSQTEALNSLQVVHKGTPLDPAVAIAYRTDSRDDPDIEVRRPIAQVAMVLDVSGSMEWRMDGSTTNVVADRRITKLKNSAKKLIEQFAASEYPVSVSLVPFSTSANNPKAFRSAQNETSTLYSNINSLSAGGGTNTGDGIRRGYHQILAGRSNPEYAGRVVSDYMIVLVDGVTTFGSVISNWNRQWVTNANNVNEGFLDRTPYNTSSGQIAGNGSSLDTTYGEPYVVQTGSMVINDTKIKVYVIGFSSRSSDLLSLANIASSTGALPTASGLPYFEAGDEDELDIIFGQIQKEILNDLWHIDGPNL